MEDVIKVFVIFIVAIVVLAGVVIVAYDIRDQERCTNKGGVWAAHNCFKKEYFMEME